MFFSVLVLTDRRRRARRRRHFCQLGTNFTMPNSPSPLLMDIMRHWFTTLGNAITVSFAIVPFLFFLSFAHVLLEFPLNHQSFIGIGRSVRERIRSPAPMTA